jgi:hypothetical protein
MAEQIDQTEVFYPINRAARRKRAVSKKSRTRSA